VTGRIAPGFVKLRFTERRTMHLTMSDLYSPVPKVSPTWKWLHNILWAPFTLPTSYFLMVPDLGRRYGVNLGTLECQGFGCGRR
jgi:hypothetical protein